MSGSEQNIIIKKVKKGGHGHHGGAWKVAYADFVTAMMAFFLLLWLLSSTSESQKEGIAEYFAPTVGVRDEMGIGFKGGESSDTEGIKKSDLTPPGIVFGAPPSGMISKDKVTKAEAEDGEESQAYEKTASEIKEAFEKDAGLAEFKEHIIIDYTPEGLRIQIIDQNNRSMFKRGSAELEDHAKLILDKITGIIKEKPNNLSVTGHTDSTPYGNNAVYTNWELSADRANSTRRYMEFRQMPDKRFARIQGKADREPLDEKDTKADRNRRIEIILLKKAISKYDVPAPDALLKPPSPDDAKPDLNLRDKTLKDEAQ